jgi:ornithine cyclodeaminase
MRIRLLDEATTRRLISAREAIDRCRAAFAQLARGEVELPEVLTIEIPAHRGEVHAKGGYLHGAPRFSIKVATGFYDNPKRGLPSTSGAVWVFDATTGFLETIILDNGFLTELRTGAAGAVAADLLARPQVETVAMIGSGAQARYQLEALLQVRSPTRVLVWNRTESRARLYAEEMSRLHGIAVAVASSAREAIEQADLVVTTTPAEEPLVASGWVRPGTHLTAMGSDMPKKRELEPALLARAKVVVDRLSQCLTQGELHHAVAAGAMTASAVYAELGEIAAGLKPGRTSVDEITIADQTGVGVLDAAVAGFVAERADALGIGTWIEA